MLHVTNGGPPDCPRCTAQVPRRATSCRRCGLVFDAWGVGEPPERVRDLLHKLDAHSGFPAVSQHIVEVNRLVGRDETTADDLADIVARDYALTTKLLKLVNSAFYRQFNRPVATITRAVVLLGFEQVRQAAVSLILYDHLRSADRQGALAKRAIQAFTGSLIARALGEETGDSSAGEAMTAAMFHGLGESLVLAFLPDEWALVAEKIAEGLSKTDAEREVLGITAEELGITVARRWAFPDSILQSMRSLLDGPVQIPRSRGEWLHAAACFANELADEAGQAAPEFERLVLRYGEALDISNTRIGPLLRGIASQVRAQVDALSYFAGGSDYVRNLVAWSAAEGTPRSDAIEEATEETRRIVRARGLDEVTTAVENGESLNSILAIVVETLYRGFEFDRVLLCVKDVRAPRMAARYGFGSNLERMLKGFEFHLERESRDVFSRACLEGRDLVVEDSSSPIYWRKIPTWYKGLVDAKAFVVYPLRVNGWPFGMLYADTSRPEETLRRSRLINIKALRDQARLALERHRRDVG